MAAPLQVQRTTAGAGLGNSSRWPAAFVTLLLLVAAGFLLIPGSIEGKSLAALHGLCAQQPTHSFWFGDARLPFDARMTGIYGGFAVASVYMLARGRWRAGRTPGLAVIGALALGVVALGADGLNSTLRDIGVSYLYEPRNALRVVTGALTGTSLAVFVWLLLGQVAFHRSARRPVAPLTSLGDYALLLLGQGAFVALILLRIEWLRVPLTFVLLAAALAAVGGLALGFVLLLARAENRALVTADLAKHATIALLVALLIIGVMGGGRFALEAWLGIDPSAPRALQGR